MTSSAARRFAASNATPGTPTAEFELKLLTFLGGTHSACGAGPYHVEVQDFGGNARLNWTARQ